MNTNILAGVIFVAVFGIVILVHEIGHFAVGKFFKVKIEEFGIGLPPKMISLFTWQETEFTINWLPFGGFNRFSGENDPEITGGLANASAKVRIAVLLAGATMNLLLGVLAYSIIFSQTGVPNLDIIQIYDVTPGSPAAQAGFRVDDIILKMNGEAINGIPGLRATISSSLDKELDLTLWRNEEIIETTAIPLSSRSETEGALGFAPGYAYKESPSIFTTIFYGAQTTFLHAREILFLPGKMISGDISPEEGRFVGFASIKKIFDESVEKDIESREEIANTAPTSSAPLPTFYTLNLIASLTITLGVFNLLPFPALDGGRIFFIIPEVIFKKRVPANLENIVHGVGLMLLLGLMFYINVMDFINPIDFTLP